MSEDAADTQVVVGDMPEGLEAEAAPVAEPEATTTVEEAPGSEETQAEELSPEVTELIEQLQLQGKSDQEIKTAFARELRNSLAEMGKTREEIKAEREELLKSVADFLREQKEAKEDKPDEPAPDVKWIEEQITDKESDQKDVLADLQAMQRDAQGLKERIDEIKAEMKFADDMIKPGLRQEKASLDTQLALLQNSWTVLARTYKNGEREIKNLKYNLSKAQDYFTHLSRSNKESERERNSRLAAEQATASAATKSVHESVIKETCKTYGLAGEDAETFTEQVRAGVVLRLHQITANDPDAPGQDIEALTRQVATKTARLMKLQEAKDFTSASKAKAAATEKMRTPGPRGSTRSASSPPPGTNPRAEAEEMRRRIAANIAARR